MSDGWQGIHYHLSEVHASQLASLIDPEASREYIESTIHAESNPDARANTVDCWRASESVALRLKGDQSIALRLAFNGARIIEEPRFVARSLNVLGVEMVAEGLDTITEQNWRGALDHASHSLENTEKSWRAFLAMRDLFRDAQMSSSVLFVAKRDY